MPGYGRSSKDAGHAVDFGVQAQVFAALLGHWGLARPHVVANDYGGAVSLRTHLVHEVPYASLLMADVVAIPPAGSPFFRLVQQHPDVLAQVPPYIHEALVRAYIGNASHRGLRAGDLAELVAPWLGAEGQPAFYRQIAAFDERYLEENEALLGRIDIPVTVVWGSEDTWIPVATGERLAAGIAGGPVRPGRGGGPPAPPGRTGPAGHHAPVLAHARRLPSVSGVAHDDDDGRSATAAGSGGAWL
ncbi:hypothetical protein FB558_2966 [Pseudonocardia kunmingensis]|uniref:Pimeloyl-ACP methyl ester carboxylesterase n=2 Tax=Pseudonocardia kunmingensis TaxID=630975 RepID=A0A543E3X9_9PSEU|nr:hypothetical protein FB558_2966 [Pseudonocardia kunmingensis]